MKKAASTKPASPKPAVAKVAVLPSTSADVPNVRIVKIANCPTLSGKSTLTYHVGSNADSEIALRLHVNTGGGFFNPDWIGLEVITTLLDKWPADRPVTSYALLPLFRGKSSNSPAFLLAVLLTEGLVQQTSEKPRHFGKGDPAKLLAEVTALMATDLDLSADVALKSSSALIKPVKVAKMASAKERMPETDGTSELNVLVAAKESFE